VDEFCSVAGDVLTGLHGDIDWATLIDSEAALQRCLTESEFDRALEAVADFTDLRSPTRVGHSRGVADLAAAAGQLCGLPHNKMVVLRRAALVHDIGLHGVPATILDKPGPLNATESERLRLHAYYSERALSRPAALARIGAIASLANERLDGSGYHRSLSGAGIPVAARILAAADSFHAMTEPRPYRPALSAKQASDQFAQRGTSGPLGRRCL
jgi:HD-GYP domain-containing protein (c-di-GMP phosphodiesterase class II)